MSREESCEARIAGELASREESIAALYERIDNADDDRAAEELDEYPLSIDKQTVYVVLLSTGGPGDQIEITCDANGDVIRVEYRFLDWFDGAVTTVEEDSAVYRYAESIAELEKEIGA